MDKLNLNEPHRHTQRFISKVILDPAKLISNINHPICLDGHP